MGAFLATALESCKRAIGIRHCANRVFSMGPHGVRRFWLLSVGSEKQPKMACLNVSLLLALP